MYGQKNMLQALKHYFGYDQFRLSQQQIIETVLNGNDVLAIMPTGGGKSICYQLPALLMEGITVVVSPLIALMKDQVDALRANGIGAAYINSTVSADEQQQIMRELRYGSIKLLYIAPERLVAGEQQFIKQFLQSLPCALFAIDEAHCISSWGHDFRPEYLQLSTLKQYFPHVPVIALTASADGITQKDIADKLALHHARVFLSSFNRANISYYIKPKKNALQQMAQYLAQHEGDSGIIYSLSRSSTETLASRLSDLGFPAAHYHAGMSSEERNRIQERFKKDEIKLIVATIAFGMGIDKSNVRFVMHYDVPKNMEGYYQETGRAGRDGLASDAIMYYSAGDIMKLMNFIEIENNAAQTNVLRKKLYQMKEFAERDGCRRQYILNYFGEQAPPYCGNCDYCQSSIEQKDATKEAQMVLSAVARTGERFGGDYIIDVLRGSQSMKIHAPHKELKTYGIGKALSKDEWQEIMKQLMQQQLVDQAAGQYPTLRLNEQSWQVLKGLRKVMMTMKKPKESSVANEEVLQPYADLLRQLKDVRMQLAHRENMPAYLIVADNTLTEMATYLPLSFDELKKISGFGDYKVAKYGPAFVEELISYARANNLKSRIGMRAFKRESKPRAPKPAGAQSVSNTQYTSLQMLKDGLAIAAIAEQRGISVATVENHLAAFVSSGELKATELMSQEKLSAILEVIRSTGSTHAAKPVKDLLPEDYSYGEIRFAMAHYQHVNG